MESTAVRRAPPLPALIQAGLIALLLVLAFAAWALTDERMGGMDAGPGTDLGGLGWFLGVWVTMMAAMMFPSVAPMVVEFTRVEVGAGERARARPAGAAALFVAGYLVAWGAVGLLGYAIVETARSLDLGFLAWDEAGEYVAGGVIVGAALYQLTAVKDACLRRCRNPQAFLTEHRHSGRIGALRTGIEHGGYCVGCCWALMAALFALGVMSIGWMAFVAALIATEKLLPWKTVANRGIAILLVVLGLAVAFAPEDVPGLTIPGSPEAMRAMEAMGMEMEGEEGSMGGGSMENEGSMGESMGPGTEGGAMEEESMAPGGGSMEK
jgi:predicted metal-binding membrane protein